MRVRYDDTEYVIAEIRRLSLGSILLWDAVVVAHLIPLTAQCAAGVCFGFVRCSVQFKYSRLIYFENGERFANVSFA